MEMFGQKDEIAIEYGFEDNPFGEAGIYGASWGTFRLWIQDCDVCSFSKHGNSQSYRWNLIGIFEWFCKNLEYVLREDQFPVQAVGNSTLSLIEDSYNYQPQDDDEFDSWADKKQDWEFRHSWYSARAGSFLARAYFRRVKDNRIEVCWDNTLTYLEHGVEFDCPRGLYLADRREFYDVVCHFLVHFANELSSHFPDDTEIRTQLHKILPRRCKDV